MRTTTPADLLGALYEDLTVWAKPVGGVVCLTQNPYDLFEILKESPVGWRLTLHWEGDGSADESARGGDVLVNRFRLVMDGDLGPTMTPKIGLIQSTTRRSPFLTMLHQVKARMLSYRWADWLSAPNDRFHYMGADDKVPLPDGLFLAAYNLSFELYSVSAQAAATVNLEVKTVEVI